MNPRHQRNPWWFCHWCPFVVVPTLEGVCARPFSTFVTNLIKERVIAHLPEHAIARKLGYCQEGVLARENQG